jgi:DNA-binding NtrC family response regulator
MNRRILCVDDNPEICDLIPLILDRFDVLTAFSVEEGRRALAAESFDLIISDIHLPDGKGTTFLDFPVPVIIISGDWLGGWSDELVRAAGVVYKGKDFVNSLSESVTDILD